MQRTHSLNRLAYQIQSGWPGCCLKCETLSYGLGGRQTVSGWSDQSDRNIWDLYARGFVLAPATVAIDGKSDHHQDRHKDDDDGQLYEGEQDSDYSNQLLQQGDNQQHQSDYRAATSQKT